MNTVTYATSGTDYKRDKLSGGQVALDIALELPGAKVLKYVKKAKTVTKISKNGYSTIYRAVSKAELDDIAINGIRNAPGYETGKLFASSAQDAANFGRLNFGFDSQSFTIIKTTISNIWVNVI